MQKALLIAEKRSLMDAIQAVYQKNKDKIAYDITFACQAGHLVQLLTPKELDSDYKRGWNTLPFFPEEHGGWQYKPISDKKHYLDKISQELNSNKYDVVIHAGDSGQEGEILINLVLQYCGNTLPVKRFWNNDLTENAILDSLVNLRDDNEDSLRNLMSAGITRQHSDYYFGMNGSIAGSMVIGQKVSIGRVRTAILGLICKREEEIKNFKPVITYQIEAQCREEQLKFKAVHINAQQENEKTKENDENETTENSLVGVRFSSLEEAKAVIKKISAGSEPLEAVVKEVRTEEQKLYAPKLYKLSTLQAAAGKLGYTAMEVLNVVQGLYDKKYVTYPRTDCEYISSGTDLKALLTVISKIDKLAPYVSSVTDTDINRVKNTKKYVNDAVLKEHEHTALSPTTLAPSFASLSKAEKDIYFLICRQFLGMFMQPCIADKTVMFLTINDYLFKTNGRRIRQRGYLELFGIESEDNLLPVLAPEQKVAVEKLVPVRKESKCPSRFTDGTLIIALENPLKYLDDQKLKALGKSLQIGTEATRAGIIDSLIEQWGYLSREGKKKQIVPTERGMHLYGLVKDFELCQIDMTGHWEELLKEVRKGHLDGEDAEEQMRQSVVQMVKDFQELESSGKIQKHSRNQIGTCPKCGKDLVEGSKGYFCSGYKEGCQIGIRKEVMGAVFSANDFLSLISGKKVKKKLKFKDGSSAEKRLVYNLEEAKLEFEKREPFGVCPRCGKELMYGQYGVFCQGYRDEPACRFKITNEFMSAKITESDAKKLLAHKKIKKTVTKKDGSKFWEQELIYNFETGRIDFA